MRLAAAVLLIATAANAQPLGTAVPISGSGCRFPDIAWSATANRFLAVWADYSGSPARICGRLVSSEGTALSAVVCYSDAIANGLYPAVAWNEVSNEFLITWDDSSRPAGGEGIWGQRVNAMDGSALGTNFKIAAMADAIRSGVTSTGSSGFAVTYAASLEAFVTFVSTSGVVGAEVNVSEDGIFSGYPAITSIGERVLATWDRDDGAIGGRLLSASTQSVIGAPFATSPVGARDRSSCAADHALGVFWVNFNDQSVGGQSFNQQAQRVGFDGALLGATINVAATPAFEGETLVGTDTSFDTFAGRALSAFQYENGNVAGLAVQELNESGALEGTTGLISTGADGVMAIAIDQRVHHAVVVWERQNGGGPHVIHLRAVQLRDTRPPSPPTVGPTYSELGDGGVALPISFPLEPDVTRVSLFVERDGGQELIGSSSSTPASLSFERTSGTQRLCATASDGTNDSAPACLEVTFGQTPVMDAGVLLDGGQQQATGDAGVPGPGGKLIGAGSCGCSASASSALLWALLILCGRARTRAKPSGARTGCC